MAPVNIGVGVIIEASKNTGAIKVASDELRSFSGEAKNAKENASLLSDAQKELNKTIENFVGAAAITAFFKEAVEESLKEAEALRTLKFAVESTGGSWARYNEVLKDYAAQQQANTRFDDTATFETLSRLARVTGNVENAMRATSLAQDIAAGSGKGLAETTELVANLMAGQERAITQARREFGAFIGEANTTQEVLDRLAGGFTGAAEGEDSFTKSLAQTTHFLQDFQQRVGDGVVPILDVLARGLAFIAKGYEELGVAIAGTVAAATQALTGLGNIMDAMLKGNFADLPNLARETKDQLISIADETQADIADIEARYSGQRQDSQRNEGQLKAQASEEEVRRAEEVERKKAEAAKKGEKERQKIEQQKIQNIADVFGVIAGISASENKKLFLAAKAASIAEATIRAYGAYVYALANPPGPPFSIPQANIALGLGLANVGVMIGTTAAGLEKGGVAQGAPTAEGSLFRLGEFGKKEAVLPLEDPRAIEPIVKALGGGGSTVFYNVFNLPGLESARDPSVIREILDTLADQIASRAPEGVRFASVSKRVSEENAGRGA